MFASRHEPAYMLLLSEEHTEKRKSKARRVFIGVLVAGFLALAATTALVLRRTPPVLSIKTTANPQGVDDPRLEKYQTPSDAILCKEWVQISSNTSLTSFILPATSSLTFFLSRGAPTQGHFKLDKSFSYPDSNYISVNVTATYDDPSQLEKSKACHAGLPLELENGIMLWASEPPHRVTFHFEVELPRYPREFGDISADFSSSAYSITVGGFGDIWRPVYFGVQRYLTNNANISFSDVTASSVYLQTSNAPINAGFFTSEQAYIRTSNALVNAVIWAFAVAPSSASNITIQNTNASVIAALALVPDNPGSTFSTSISTTNEELAVQMVSGIGPDPVEKVTYILDASTSNAPAHVLVPDDYEGSFAMQTTGSRARARVQWDSEVKDPFRKGRNRSLVLDEWEQGRMAGNMYWGDKAPQGRDLGDVRVKTSGGDVTLLTSWRRVQVERLSPYSFGSLGIHSGILH